MRISLADSVRQGFRKWSDAQEAKPASTAIDHLAESIERRRPTAIAVAEGRDDDAG